MLRKPNIKHRTLLRDFWKSETTAGMLLIAVSALSLILANCEATSTYAALWHITLLGKTLEFWINDGLMTIFFLMVGLEIERELYKGELSHFRNAILPISAAVGGMLVPAAIHYMFNRGLDTASGFGVP